jgi:hypothetical protein
MAKKIVNVPREQWSAEHLKFWREGKLWCCAVPRDDFATQNGLSWKKFGLIGRGSTRKAATEDWESWLRAADLVADIY